MPHMLALERGKTAVARPGVRILPTGDGARELTATVAPQLQAPKPNDG